MMGNSLKNRMQSPAFQQMLPVIGASIPMIILGIAFLSIPLSAAEDFQLSTAQTASWIIGIYAVAGIVSLLFSWHYHQPLFLTGNVFVLLFVVSLAQETPYEELIGACTVAGVIVVLVTLLGLTERLAAIIPPPVILGLLSGVLIAFVSDLFSAFGESPIAIGGTFITYLLARRFLGKRVPAILPALVIGLILAGFASELNTSTESFTLPPPVLTTPVFSIQTIVSVTPVLVIVIVLQSNIPSIIFMKTQGYEPPERNINLASGAATAIGALLGPIGVSLSLPATSIAAGDEAGEFHLRHRAAYIAAGAMVAIGLLAGIAAFLAQVVPSILFLSIAGLALVDVLVNTLARITTGSLRLGPVFALAIALSEIKFLGFGTYFWAIVIGTGVSMLLEQNSAKISNSPADE